MMCLKVIYIQALSRLRLATGIQMVIFIKLVQYAKNQGGKSWKILVEHQIIKNKKTL